MHRSTLLACATAASLLAGGSLAAASTANPAVHDAAGDAQNSRGQNVPSVDILSADVTVDGTTLVYRENFAAKPTLSGPVSYAQAFYTEANNHDPSGPGLTLGSSISGGSATFAAGYKPAPSDCDDCYPTAAVTVPGTAVVTGSSIVTTYSLTEINRQFAANGYAPIKTGTTYYDPYAFSDNQTPATALDRLQAQNNAKNAADEASGQVYDHDTYTFSHTSFVLGS